MIPPEKLGLLTAEHERPLEECFSAYVDYYKFTMSQEAWKREPDAIATFTFHNRNTNERMLDYFTQEELQARLDEIRSWGFLESELNALRAHTTSDGTPRFAEEYLEYLRASTLPRVEVKYDPEIDDIVPVVTGPWALATFWENIVMNQISEIRGVTLLQQLGYTEQDAWREGVRRLDEKIALFKQHPGIKFTEFGTRRRFSLKWQMHVIDRLMAECPENYAGTSNVALAHLHSQEPFGTFAHELPMVYAALADARGESIRASHNLMLRNWYESYGPDLAIALTDTYGREFFIEDFTPDQAANWRGLRQDSGDPFEAGEDFVQAYADWGVDPTDKSILFSDSLNAHKMVELQQRFAGRIKPPFGVGTDFTHDVGLISAPNIVMKVTFVRVSKTDPRGAEAVKLSDDEGKHTGSPEKVREYQEEFKTRSIGRSAVRGAQ